MAGFNSVQNWLDFSVKTIKRHFYSQLEDFQPCYSCLGLPVHDSPNKRNVTVEPVWSTRFLLNIPTTTNHTLDICESEFLLSTIPKDTVTLDT